MKQVIDRNLLMRIDMRPVLTDRTAKLREIVQALGDKATPVLETLTPREESIIRLRCGLVTMIDVDCDSRLTKERIRQIEAKAWRKIAFGLDRADRLFALYALHSENVK